MASVSRQDHPHQSVVSARMRHFGTFERAICAIACLGLCALLPGCAGIGGAGKSGAEGEYVMYPPSPEEPRIQFLAHYSKDSDVVPPPSGFRSFVLGEAKVRELGKPYGVAVHDGKILVCDSLASVVAIFDLRDREVEVLGAGANGRLQKPINVSVDEDGTRYVVDVKLRRLMVYDRDNRYLRAIGDPEAWDPTDVAIVGKRLFVLDKQNSQVVVIEKATGVELKRWGQPGSGVGEFYFPTNVAVGRDESVYVADTGNFRVLKFNRRGKFLRRFGKLGQQLGQFVRPKGVAVDREDRLYVVDAATEVVQIFNPDGELLLFFGGPGNQRGGLTLPAKVTISYDSVEYFADRVAPGYEIDYLILVTSQFGPNKVNVYGFIKPLSKRGD